MLAVWLIVSFLLTYWSFTEKDGRHIRIIALSFFVIPLSVVLTVVISELIFAINADIMDVFGMWRNTKILAILIGLFTLISSIVFCVASYKKRWFGIQSL